MPNLLKAVTSLGYVRRLLSLDTGVLRVNVDNVPVMPTNIISNYNDGVYHTDLNESLAAGTNYLTLPTVPAGHVYVYTHVAYRYVGTITNVYLTLRLHYGGTGFWVLYTRPPVSGTLYFYLCNLYAKEDAYLRLQIDGATLNNDVYLYATGYDFSV